MWVVIGLALTAVVGLVILVDSGPPDDPLHIVYGVLAVSALPLAAAIAAGRSDGQRAVIAVVAMIVLAVLVLRLFETGGA